MYFCNEKSACIVYNMTACIHENKEYLSGIDGAIGDGDHGINMDKGFSLCRRRMEDIELSFSEALTLLSDILLQEIGGSMGPIYGVMFKKMAEILREEKIDQHIFLLALKAAITGIQSIGDAKPGDKTLIDTLIPAADALEASNNRNEDFEAALLHMKKAAEEGWQSTKDMVAKLGRASRLGERSRGIYDAGATSSYLLLSSMADSIVPLLCKD
ncbi:MAG: dihydroxyacetone kinase subunit DhaL [Treponema sp.]|nr:dihydroxyacetone kinase subunit DhaL [Treponema sp.]